MPAGLPAGLPAFVPKLSIGAQSPAWPPSGVNSRDANTRSRPEVGDSSRPWLLAGWSIQPCSSADGRLKLTRSPRL